MKIPNRINIKEDLHFQVFTRLNDLLSWGITPSDIKILSELYNIDYEMAATGNVKDYDNRMAILFSSDVKRQIMDKLGMSYNTFNNSLSKLRKKGLIVGNSIPEKRLLNLSKSNFVFTIEFMDEEEYTRFIRKKAE